MSYLDHKKQVLSTNNFYSFLRSPKPKDYQKAAILLTDRFKNLRDSVKVSLNAAKNKTLEELRIVTARESIVRATRNRRARAPKSAPFESPAIKSSSTESFLNEWPFLSNYKGLIAEFRVMMSLKNIDYITARIWRLISNI